MNRKDNTKKVLWISGGRVIDPASGLDQEADILIEGGLIAELRSSPLPAGRGRRETGRAKTYLLCPPRGRSLSLV